MLPFGGISDLAEYIAFGHRSQMMLLQGVKHYDPAVVTQLLEFLYRYMSDVVQDAEVPTCTTPYLVTCLRSMA